MLTHEKLLEACDCLRAILGPRTDKRVVRAFELVQSAALDFFADESDTAVLAGDIDNEIVGEIDYNNAPF